MRKELIAAVSALALMTGAAFAQSSSGGASSGSAGTAGSGAATSGATTQRSPDATGGTAATSPTTQSQSSAQSGAAGGQLASAEKMMGKNVYGQNNEKIGEVEDIILDPQSGQAKQLILSSGGFLGIGDKKVAVDFSKAQFDQQQDRVQISDMTQDQVKNMQEFQYTDNMQSMNRRSGSASGNTAGSGASGSAGSPSATGTTGSSSTATPPASGTSQQPKQ